MMLGRWRYVAALLLLVHLMTLSEGLNVNGKGAVKDILSKNLSIILIDGKTDSLDTNITNATALNPAYNSNNNDRDNDSMVLKDAMRENIKILETELEEAIESAAISGQVIMLSSPVDGTNSSNPPLIIIENPDDYSQSATINKLINETIEQPIPKLDQEIAQSQNQENYKDNENSENLEDLMAIAEYEPQRIDARRIEGKNPQVSSEQADFDDRTTAIRPNAEVTHYDVPKRKEYPKNLNRISDVYRSTTTKPDLKVSSTGQVQRAAGPPKSDQLAIERKDIKAERRQFSSPSTFYHKPTAVPAKFLDDEVNSKVEIASRVKSSIPYKFTYDLSRTINSLAEPLPKDSKSTPDPGYPRKIDAPPRRNIRNLIDVSESLNKNNVHSSRVNSVEIPSSSPYRSFGGNVSIDSISPTSGTARASRRVDNNFESSNREVQPLTNAQLGFLTRYNLPSLVAGKFGSSRSYPVPSRNSRTGSTDESRSGENQHSETKNQRRSRTLIPVSDSYEVNGSKNTKHVVDHPNGERVSNPIRSSGYDPYVDVDEEAVANHRVDNTAYQRNGNQALSSTTPAYDAYEVNGRKNTKHVVDHPNRGRVSNPIRPSGYDPYVDVEEETVANHRVDNTAYRRNGNQALSSTTPVYDSYEVNGRKNTKRVVDHPNHRVDNTAYQRNGNQALSATTPAYDAYEVNGSKNTKRVVDHHNRGRVSNPIRPSGYDPYVDVEEEKVANHRVDNTAYQRNGNQPLSSTTSVYDSYEVNGSKNTKRVVDHPNRGRVSNPIRPSGYDPYVDVEEEKVANHRVDNTAYQRNGNQALSSTTPAYDAYEIYPKPVRSSLIASTTPSHDFYEDYKESNTKSVKDSPVESYEDYKESSEDSKIVRNSLSTPREDYEKIGNSKTVRKTPIASSEYYQESENSKASRASPVASYEDYGLTENTKIVKNSPVVSQTPVYDFYEDYEKSDGRSSLPQSRRLIVNDPEPPKRVHINSYPVAIQSRPVQQSTPINLLNNPIYKLHGLRSTPLPVNGVYNPYVNYSAGNPSFVNHLEKHKTQAPRETVINQRVTYTTPLYDSHENISQASRPSVSLSGIINQNNVKNRIVKPTYNSNNEITESESITPIKKNSEKYYRERGVNRHAVSTVNTIMTSPSQAVPRLRGDVNRANSLSPLDHVENSESEEYEESIDRGDYSSDTGTDSRNLRPSMRPHYQESHNQAAKNTASSTLESHENGDRGIVSSTSNRAKLIEPHSADYGSRISSRVVGERQQGRIVEPSSTHAFATIASERGTGRKASSLNDDQRRKDVDEAPVESVNQARVGDSSDYEDEVPASSGHEEKHENYKTHEEAKNGHGDEYKHEEGGGQKHKEDHHVSHGEKGEKGYKDWHEHDKGEKGHHDKESHDKEYDEKKGETKKHQDESDYHKEHHHEEKGDKEAEFGEKGEHQKGHSTKGQHVVHKKDEYEKKTEFYDESHEEDDEEKEGGYGEEHEYEKGGHEKIGHHDSGHHEDKYGKKDEHEKGHHYHEHEGHKNTDGHNEHHHHEEKYGKKGGHEEGNKWSHEKGDNGKKSS